MSIPIDFRFETWQDGEKQTMVQLKDGSVYVLYVADKPYMVADIEPVSRSYMGMLLKDEMRETLTNYIEARKLYKEACRIGEFDLTASVSKEVFRKNAEEFMEEYRYYQKCWKKFKAHSTKAKRKVDPEEAETKKNMAMKLKSKMKKEAEKPTMTRKGCGCNARRRRN